MAKKLSDIRLNVYQETTKVMTWIRNTLNQTSGIEWYISSYIRDAPMHNNGMGVDLSTVRKFNAYDTDPRWPDKPGVLSLTSVLAFHPFDDLALAIYVEDNHLHINMAQREAGIPSATAFRWSVDASHKYPDSQSRIKEVRAKNCISHLSDDKQILYTTMDGWGQEGYQWFPWDNDDVMRIKRFAQEVPLPRRIICLFAQSEDEIIQL